MLLVFFLMIRRPPRSTLFPTRRSSDLGGVPASNFQGSSFGVNPSLVTLRIISPPVRKGGVASSTSLRPHRDRKSTRLNSSHANISYAVFCLKKKKYTSLILPYLSHYNS